MVVTISAGRYESVQEFYAAFQLRCSPQCVCQVVVAVGVSVCGYYQQAPKLSTTGSIVSQTVQLHDALRKAIQGGATY